MARFLRSNYGGLPFSRSLCKHSRLAEYRRESSLDTLRKLRSILSPREQRQALALLFVMIGAALIEVAGVASVMPFILVLTDTSLIHSNPILARVYQSAGFNDERTFLIALGLVLLFTFLLSLAFRAFNMYLIQRYTSMRLHSFGRRLLANYLEQPHEFFLNSNSAALSKKILSEVANVANGILLPLLRAISGLVVSIAILTLLFVVEPQVSLAMGASLGFSYLLIFMISKARMKRSCAAFIEANTRRFIVASEALQGYKELRVLGRLGDYLQRFEAPSKAFAKNYADNQIGREMPYYLVQAVAFGGIVALLLVLIAQRKPLDDILPVVTFFAFAGYRLLPSFQDIFRSFGHLRFYLPSLDELYDDLTRPSTLPVANQPLGPLRFENCLCLKSITFQYEGGEKAALNSVSMRISAGSKVGIIGQTGAGKSTLVDILLGLIPPGSGQLSVDGVVVNATNVGAWQRNIGYVPQSIFLADDTIAANIAFGVPREEIDLGSVREAARRAQIDDVVDTLPQGYDTVVGERGARLSGGQIQRIGIARALYNRPRVLILDEATSALDIDTEAAVMEAINALQRSITVIIVAHRLATIQGCDQVFEIQGGRLLAAESKSR